MDSDSSDNGGSINKKGTQSKAPLPCEALLKWDSRCANKWELDLQVLKEYRKCKDIYLQDLKGPNFSNQSDYIHQMMADDGLGLNIITSKAVYTRLKNSKSNVDKVNKGKLKEVVQHEIILKSGAKMEFLLECFIYPKTKPRIPNNDENGYYSQAMLGLYSLHNYQAMSKITTSDTRLPTGDK